MNSIFDEGKHDEVIKGDKQEVARFREAHEDSTVDVRDDPRPGIVNKHLQIYLESRPACGG